MEENNLEKLTLDYQKVEEQLQALAMQKEQFTAQKDELNHAKEQIEGSVGKIYSSVGGTIIEATKEAALDDIKEKSELTDMRLTMLKKQIDELKKREQELREKVMSMVKGQNGK
ncbi:MAG: prefoldin subunit [Methanothrix sp.]